MLPEITLDWLQARVREDEDGCWIWTGYTTKQGQPHARVNYVFFLVRRAVWEQVHARELSPKFWAGVRCEKPGCVHPDCVAARSRSQALQGRSLSAAHKASIAKTKRAASRVSDDDILLMRTSELSAQEISRQLGVCDSYASSVRRNRLRADHSNPFTGLLRAAGAGA